METYGTLQEFLNRHNPPLHMVIIRTSDYYYFGESLHTIDHLLDNEMYAPPQYSDAGYWLLHVQD